MDFTVEVYLADRRFRAGEHMINKIDLTNVTLAQARSWGPNLYGIDHSRSYRFEIHETWVTRKNLITGQEFSERYDTPWTSSPASETYWSA